jgi:hypothetical protein
MVNYTLRNSIKVEENTYHGFPVMLREEAVIFPLPFKKIDGKILFPFKVRGSIKRVGF